MRVVTLSSWDGAPIWICPFIEQAREGTREEAGLPGLAAFAGAR
jgi:hypothetical protein